MTQTEAILIAFSKAKETFKKDAMPTCGVLIENQVSDEFSFESYEIIDTGKTMIFQTTPKIDKILANRSMKISSFIQFMNIKENSKIVHSFSYSTNHKEIETSESEIDRLTYEICYQKRLDTPQSKIQIAALEKQINDQKEIIRIKKLQEEVYSR